MNVPMIPMTSGQQGLFYLSQIDDEVNASYNVVVALETAAALDIVSLQRALDSLIERHSLLGARIVQPDGVPGFEPLGDGACRVATSGDGLRATARAESARPFALFDGPLCRVTLVDGPAPDTHGLVVCLHHIVCDGPSLAILLDELATAYDAHARSAAPIFAAAPFDWSRVVDREQRFAQSPQAQGQIDAIVERAQSFAQTVSLMGRGAARESRARRGGQRTVELPAQTAQAVATLARELRSTPFCVHLAAFGLLMVRYGAPSDLGVAVPVSLRTEDASQAIGYLVNIGVACVRLRWKMRNAELVEAATEQALQLLDERHVSFPALVRAFKRAGCDFQAFFSQLAFSYQRTPRESWDFGGIGASPVAVDHRYAKNALKLEVEETPGALRCSLIFDADAFPADLIDGMLDAYVAVLLGILDRPQALLADTPYVSAVQRDQLDRWSRGPQATLPVACLHQLVEASVDAGANRPAIVHGETTLSYAELERRANQLAHHLIDAGVGAERLVALCLPRSVAQIVAMLAVLKAGGAYVPLDGPRERLRRLLDHLRPSLLLADSSTLDRLPVDRPPTLCLDAEHDRIGGRPPSRPEVACRPTQLAYALYTSGSTGEPKAVAAQHSSAVAFVAWLRDHFADTLGRRVLHASAATFDMSVIELYATLSAGGCVVMVGDPSDLVLGQGVDNLQFTSFVPSTASVLVDAGAIDKGCRVLILGGETVQRALLERLHGACSDARIYNTYGPTETTAFCTSAEMHRTASSAISIGQPIGNVRVYLLDRQLDPVPPGAVGEICIAGPTQARGYLGAPQTTAAYFVPDPFGPAGSRMYRSGDLGRYLGDGSIEHLGRIDDQVKIRGVRIEPAEIELALSKCAGVREAVVRVDSGTQGEKRLVAYVVPSAASHGLADVREQLRERLPDAMLPSAWVQMEAFPLNTAGKVDRLRLPAPAPETGAAFAAPSTATQLLLAGIWAEVLQADRIGLHDNFFVLGGHSLLATRILARLSAQLGRRLPLRILLDHPTVFEMAQKVDELMRAEPTPGDAAAPAIRRQRRSGDSNDA